MLKNFTPFLSKFWILTFLVDLSTEYRVSLAEQVADWRQPINLRLFNWRVPAPGPLPGSQFALFFGKYISYLSRIFQNLQKFNNVTIFSKIVQSIAKISISPLTFQKRKNSNNPKASKIFGIKLILLYPYHNFNIALIFSCGCGKKWKYIYHAYCLARFFANFCHLRHRRWIIFKIMISPEQSYSVIHIKFLTKICT